MAIEALSRWQMIREIILENRSGTLIVQLGKNFLHWMIAEGKVIGISSTLPEYSLTQFLLTHGKPERSQLLKAQGLIHDQRSLGSALVDSNSLTVEQLCGLLEEHRASLSHHLLQASSHLFWSDRQAEYKHHFVRCDEPLQNVLLSADRSFIDTRAAIRFAQNLPVHYRLAHWTEIEKYFLEPEKRLLNYLKSCAPLAAMLKDPELDRMTCYRMLFLLWLAGALQEPVARKGKIVAAPPRMSLIKRARSLPPDWIFPLIAGVIIGALLAPGPSRSGLARSSPHIESLRNAIQQSQDYHKDTKKSEDLETTDEH